MYAGPEHEHVFLFFRRWMPMPPEFRTPVHPKRSVQGRRLFRIMLEERTRDGKSMSR